ncbi:MAG: PaaI family thioesterase [Promethearchaeota archaeon]
MKDINQDIEKRSNRIIKLFNAAKGRNIGDFPGTIPPFSKYLNGKLLNAKRGEVELEFKVREEWANPTGLLHGGMQGALIDDTIGITTATLGYKGFLISIDSQLNYLGKVKVGEIVRTKARLIREGRNIVNFYCEICDAEGNLIATGNSNLLKTQYTPDYVKNVDKDEQF